MNLCGRRAAFREKSWKHREISKGNKYPHPLGTIGYTGKAKVWEQEDPELANANPPTKFSHSHDLRTRTWVKARETSITSSGITDDPDSANAEAA